MEREIKFRIWCIPDKRMDFTSLDDFMFSDGYYYTASSEHFNVMQFTGLQDKNGVDIYEGDIVVKNNSPLREIIEFKELENREGGIITGFEFPSAYQEDLIVIGNIYENPELVK